MTQYQREGEVVLARWRAVERLIEAEADGGPVDPLLQAEYDRLRDLYHATIEAARARQERSVVAARRAQDEGERRGAVGNAHDAGQLQVG